VRNQALVATNVIWGLRAHEALDVRIGDILNADGSFRDGFTMEGRVVKKLMRLHVRSISGAPRAVRDTALGLHALWLGLLKDREGHFPFPNGFARDDNAPHTLGAYTTGSLHQTGSDATGLRPSPI
jgi:hypothetical protein